MLKQFLQMLVDKLGKEVAAGVLALVVLGFFVLLYVGINPELLAKVVVWLVE